MKTMSFFLLLLILLLVVPSNSFAQAWTYTEWGKITSLNMTSDGSLTVDLSSARINPASCTFKAYLVLKSDAKFAEYYSFILASKGFNSDVRFRISNTVCVGGVDPNAQISGNGYSPSIVFIETRDPS